MDALGGVRVVDLGEGVASAFCARLFADYGAEVVKVEPRAAGDPTRHWGPFPGDRPDPESSGTFFFYNTGKLGIRADVGDPRDRESVLALLRRTDVIIESQPLARLEAWNLAPAQLCLHNKDAIVISLSPYGRTGPYAHWRGCDLNAFHLSAAGHRYCGRPDAEPLEHGTFSAECFGAYVGAAWGLAALHGRERAGGGQHLDVSCSEVIAALFTGGQTIGGYLQDGRFDRRSGSAMSLAMPATLAPTRDGHVWLIALEPAQWDGLRRAMGDPEWARPELFRDMFERAKNADWITPLLFEWTRQYGKQELMDRCQAERVPVTAVLSVGEAVDHPHLAARGYRVVLDHPRLGPVPTLGAPVLLPDCPGGPQRAAPLLGEHDAELPRITERWARAHASKARSAPGSQPSADPDALPLRGLRVANFGWGLVGPVAGQLLAFLGADVVKIESRKRVDVNRKIPPYAGGIASPDRSLQNHAHWAGNRSVTLDLADPEGVGLAKRLVAHCDLALENFAPGTLDRLGLGFEALRAVRPDLVLVSMPAAGSFGPLHGVRTYGTSLASLTGLDSITGYLDSGPSVFENAFRDPLGGIVGAFGALLALEHRRRSGRGQHVDYSQQEGVMQLVGPAAMDWWLNRRDGKPLGNRHPLAAMAPHGLFRCAGEDRWLSLAVASDAEWQALVSAMGSPAWARDAALAAHAGRRARIAELHARISEWMANRDNRELAESLQAQGVAAAPVLDVAGLASDPEFRTRRTFVEVEHPQGFRETIYGAYVKTSRTRVEVRPGPAMGQDNEAVLKGLLGLSDAEYERAVASGAVS
jgi:benzylsuccinate CoA-transferase BbsF subunit